jgi:molybdopterin converting factor subunit 1
MKVRVHYFAVVRERLGLSSEVVDICEHETIASLLRTLESRRPALVGLRAALRVALNEEFVDEASPLCDGDEIALIPPVSGGSQVFRVSDAPLDLEEVVRAVSADAHGGIVTFTGVVRNLSHGKKILKLEYEAYRPMAERKMAEIGRKIADEIAGVRVAIVHRVGTLTVGEAAVVIAASAPHRAQAFEACRAAIDRLKESVPIWKKEIAEDGEEWIGLGP